MLDGLAERAAKLCEAEDAAIFRVDGNSYRRAAHFGPVHMATALGEGESLIAIRHPGQAIADRATIHVHDLQTAGAHLRGVKTRGISMGLRTAGFLPHRYSVKVWPLVLFIFADERSVHSRVSKLNCWKPLPPNESPSRTSAISEELKESLEQQTATSEILVSFPAHPLISNPVLDTIAENAARVCGSCTAAIRLVEGNTARLAAHYGPVEPGFGVEQPLTPVLPAGGRAVLDRELIHIQDLMAVV